MRSSFLLLILVIAIYVSDNLAAEPCPPENCMSSCRCESFWNGAECPNNRDTCCSIVKEEYRTACRHYGGECLTRCNTDLQRPATNCPTDTVCCVLV